MSSGGRTFLFLVLSFVCCDLCLCVLFCVLCFEVCSVFVFMFRVCVSCLAWIFAFCVLGFVFVFRVLCFVLCVLSFAFCHSYCCKLVNGRSHFFAGAGTLEMCVSCHRRAAERPEPPAPHYSTPGRTLSTRTQRFVPRCVNALTTRCKHVDTTRGIPLSRGPRCNVVTS